jgi:hypothetical protein
MSFWLNKPVQVTTENSKQILSNTELLLKINKEISESKLKLDYNVLNNETLYLKKDQILQFINDNYKTSNDSFSLVYKKDTLDFFLNENNVLVIEFYPKSNPKQIGLIIGKKENIVINNNSFNSLEVNFLCLNEKLRNLHVSSLMINILTKECVERFDIGTAYYTIGKPIKSPSFCTKKMFHRPINISNLIETEFLDSDNENFYRKTYNSFKSKSLFSKFKSQVFYNTKITYISKSKNQDRSTSELNGIVNDIYNGLDSYQKSNYKIYENISKDIIRNLLENDSFHHFLFYSITGKLENYFCFMELDTLNTNNQKIFKNGVLYKMFSSDTTDNYALKPYSVILMEEISKYVYEKKLFDVITVHDIFKNQASFNYLNGTGILKYYMFNMTIPKIEHYENGLVTI